MIDLTWINIIVGIAAYCAVVTLFVTGWHHFISNVRLQEAGMDLFDYPNQPGFKEQETSRAAAEAIAPRTPRLRAACLRVIARQPATPDEVADELGLSILSIRPRFTELARTGRITDTGLRRPNQSGRMAKVWCIKETAQ
jgi:hypothetical protein